VESGGGPIDVSEGPHCWYSIFNPEAGIVRVFH
jgi:hypothetical protein